MKLTVFFLITLFFVTKTSKIRLQQQSVTCGSNTISWDDKTVQTGSIRQFHTRWGSVVDLKACKDLCARDSTCMTAIFTPSKACYAILTSNKDICSVLRGGSFGASVEACSVQRPCLTSNKICSTPSCSLNSITSIFCNTGDLSRAKTICTK